MVVVANLKMNQDYHQCLDYVQKLKENKLNKDIIICPSSLYIPYFLNNNFSVGIQNIYLDGLYTGEISALQAKSMGIDYCIIGHSERRINFKEDENLINKKIKDAIKSNLKVILCVGEYVKGDTEIIRKQLYDDLRDIDVKNVYIAYEPAWIIGKNMSIDYHYIEKNISLIKENYHTKILYGGSVSSYNIKELKKLNIDGFLIGGSALDINEFIKIIEETKNTI